MRTKRIMSVLIAIMLIFGLSINSLTVYAYDSGITTHELIHTPEVVEDSEYEYGHMEFCNCGIDHTNKPFEWWSDITDTNSPQWDLIHNYLIIQEDGTLQTDDGFIACALGRHFGKIGTKWIFICEDGSEIKVIKTDEKQDRHTKNGDLIHGIICNELIELVVDSKISKTCPSGNFKDLPGLEGNIIGWKQVLNNDLPNQLKGTIFK